jgi:YfiR/HmsC-like
MDLLTLSRSVVSLRGRARLWLVCLVTLIGSLGLARLLSSQARLPTGSGSGGISLEYQVKAAYLLNFTRYVEWPSQAFTDPKAPVTICVLGRDPFGSVLDATVVGRTTQGRSVSVRRIRSTSEVSGCHLVFISRETWRSQRDLPRTLHTLGLLTVGESGEFAQQGGVIGFIIQNETVRFVVNAEARDRAGLRISSRMLSLAAAVYGQGPGS